MKTQELKFKDKSSSYSILIGKNIINHLPIKIKRFVQKQKKIAIIMDNNVPKKFNKILKLNLKTISYTFSIILLMKKQNLCIMLVTL